MAVSPQKEQALKRGLIALSLANLCFTGMWVEVLTLGSPVFVYFRTGPPDWRLVPALVLNVAVVAVAAYFALQMRHSASNRVRLAGTLLFAAISLFTINELRHMAVVELRKQNPLPSLKYVQPLGMLALAVVVWRMPQRMATIWRQTLLIISPLFFILLANALWLYRTPGLRHAGRGQAAGMLQGGRKAAARVIWIVFDELDQHLAFEARPMRIRMPQFDRLRNQSIYAAKALAPGGFTDFSLPSLICGRRFAAIKGSATDARLNVLGSKEWVLWSSQPNLFRRCRAQGFDTGLSGWYHPYCRIIGKDLSDCAWEGSFRGVGAAVAEDYLHDRWLGEKAYYLADWQLRSAPLAGLVSPDRAPYEAYLGRRRAIREYRFLLDKGLAMLRKRDIDLVMIHLPVPHPFGIWDARKHSFSMDRWANYIDNLELVDRTLGTIRQMLEAQDDWNQSAVLVSADHPLRASM